MPGGVTLGRGRCVKVLTERNPRADPAVVRRAFCWQQSFGSPLLKALKSPTAFDLPWASGVGVSFVIVFRTIVHKFMFCAKLARKP